jgi:hypothetical protein
VALKLTLIPFAFRMSFNPKRPSVNVSPPHIGSAPCASQKPAANNKTNTTKIFEVLVKANPFHNKERIHLRIKEQYSCYRTNKKIRGLQKKVKKCNQKCQGRGNALSSGRHVRRG